MVKKILFISLALFGLLFSEMAEECFADAATQFKQAETYKKNKQYDQAEQIYQQILINFPDSNDALEAQKQLTLIYIATDRQAEADAAFAELTAGFAGHKEIAEAIWHVGRKYMKAEKYDKAGEVHQYNVENFTDDVYAMLSQMEIVYFHIRQGDDAALDGAVDKLLTAFSTQPALPERICEVAKKLEQKANPDKALELHRYNVEHYPDDKYAMWSQIDIVKFYIGDGNDPAAADAAVDKLTNVFSEQETLAKEIYKIAERYQRLKRLDKAYECYQYVAENCDDDERALLSQQQVVSLSLQLEDDAGIDAAVDKLLTGFAGQPGLPEKICEIVKKLYQKGKREKALELHRYNVEHYPEDKYAMWSQIEIVKFYIGDGNDAAAADAAVDKLISVFSEQKTLAKEIYKIANRYNKAGKFEKGMQLHKYNIDNFPADANAMWSQVDIFETHLADPNGSTAADAAVQKLLGVFSDNPKLPKAIRSVAKKYNASGRSDKAMELWMRNVDNSPNNVNAMLSQMDIIYSYIDPNDGNDAAVDAAVDKFLTVFADQPTLPEKVYQIGNKYRDSGKYDRAIQFYQLAAERWPEDKIAITSRAAIGKVHIELGDDEAVQTIIDGLIADYNDHPHLPKAIFRIGEEYYNEAFWCENDGLETEAKENFTKAIAVWGKIMTELPPSATTPEAYYFSAVCYSRLRQHTKAIEQYQNVVANWPDCENASRAQFMVARIYEHLERTGALPEAEAVAMIKAAYERILQEYPDSRAANPARRRLNYYQQLKQGERK